MISRGTDHHHVRTSFDPVVVCFWLLRVGMSVVAGVGATREHVHEADLTFRRLLVFHPGGRPLQCILIHAHGVRSGVVGLSVIHVKLFVPFRIVRIFPSAVTAMMVASLAIATGAADLRS